MVASGTTAEWAAVILNGPAFAQGRPPARAPRCLPHGGGRRLDVRDVKASGAQTRSSDANAAAILQATVTVHQGTTNADTTSTRPALKIVSWLGRQFGCSMSVQGRRLPGDSGLALYRGL